MSDFFDDIPDAPKPRFDKTSPGGSFGAPRPYGGHTGADFPWPEGERVGVPKPGKVRFAGNRKGYGNRVEVEHDDGTVTTYSHLSKIDVRPDDDLDEGSLVGLVGSTGGNYGKHLHYEVLKGGRKVDPLQTGLAPVRGAAEVKLRNGFFSDVPEADSFFNDLPPAAPAIAVPPPPVRPDTALPLPVPVMEAPVAEPPAEMPFNFTRPRRVTPLPGIVAPAPPVRLPPPIPRPVKPVSEGEKRDLIKQDAAREEVVRQVLPNIAKDFAEPPPAPLKPNIAADFENPPAIPVERAPVEPVVQAKPNIAADFEDASPAVVPPVVEPQVSGAPSAVSIAADLPHRTAEDLFRLSLQKVAESEGVTGDTAQAWIEQEVAGMKAEGRPFFRTTEGAPLPPAELERLYRETAAAGGDVAGRVTPATRKSLSDFLSARVKTPPDFVAQGGVEAGRNIEREIVEAGGGEAELARVERVARMGWLEYLGQAPKGVVTGLAGTASGALEGVGLLSTGPGAGLNPLGAIVEGLRGTTQGSDTLAYQAGKRLDEWTRWAVQTNPDLEQEFLVGKAPNAVGSLAGFLLGGWAAKAPKVAATVLGGLSGGATVYEEVKSLGGSEAEAQKAALIGMGVLGPLEIVPVSRMLNRLNQGPKAAGFRAAFKNLLIESGEEAIQEGGSEGLTGLISGKRRSAGEIIEAAALGAVAGGGTSAAISSLNAVSGAEPGRAKYDKPFVWSTEDGRHVYVEPTADGYKARPVSAREAEEYAKKYRRQTVPVEDFEAAVELYGTPREEAPTARGLLGEAPTETPATVSHPNPDIDGKPVVATTGDGRVVVANPSNKSGVSVVKPRGPDLDATRAELEEVKRFVQSPKARDASGELTIEGQEAAMRAERLAAEVRRAKEGDDRQDAEGLAGEERAGAEPLEARPVAGAGGAETPAGRDVQEAEGAEAQPEVEIPAEESIVNPIDRTANVEEKVRQLRKLSEENVPLIERIIGRVGAELGLESRWSHKLPERIAAKASRPSIRATRPWFDVEHVRDSLRFKSKLEHLEDVPRVARILAESGVEIVKTDTRKMVEPKEWGWRFVAFDLRMPNGQLVEYYAPLKELDTKEVKGENHKLFEKWRNRPLAEIAESHVEYERDLQASYQRYGGAWKKAIERMGYASEEAAIAAWSKVEASLGSVTRTNESLSSSGETTPTDQPLPSKTIGLGSAGVSEPGSTITLPDVGSLETNITAPSGEIVTPPGTKINEKAGADVPVGPHGKFSSLLRQTTPLDGNKANIEPENLRPAFSAHPAVRRILGLPPTREYASTGPEGAEYQGQLHQALGNLAEEMGLPRSSHVDQPTYDEWVRRHRDELPDTAVEAYVATTAAHAAHVEQHRKFILDAETVSLLRGMEQGNDTKQAAARIRSIAKGYGISRAIADAAIKTARDIRRGIAEAVSGGEVSAGDASGEEAGDTGRAEEVGEEDVDAAVNQADTNAYYARRSKDERQQGLFADAGPSDRGVAGGLGSARDRDVAGDEAGDVPATASGKTPRASGDTRPTQREAEVRGTRRAGDEPDDGARTGDVGVDRSPAAAESTGDERGAEDVDRDLPAKSPDEEALERERAALAGEDATHQTSPALTSNYRITDLASHAAGTPGEKFQHNIDALKTMRRVVAEGRPATPEEQQILARWVGWGQFPQAFNKYGATSQADARRWDERRAELKELLSEEEFNSAAGSTLNAHFTAAEIVDGMWKMLDRLGFKGGKVLEPSMGSGNYFGLIPAHMNGPGTTLTGVELDPITGHIARLLYPQSDVKIKGFEEFAAPENHYDVAISNVPFGDYKVHDPAYNQHQANIHDYFFLKSLDKVRPGGIVAFITSTGTMDKQSSRVRKQIAKRGELIAAFRLPGETFQKNAGTSVVTDILILRKKDPSVEQKRQRLAAVQGLLKDLRGELEAWNKFPSTEPLQMQNAAATQREFAALEREQADLHRLLAADVPGEAWMELGSVPDPDTSKPTYMRQPIPVNEYYVSHPENILGTLDRTGSMYRGNEVNVTPTDDFAQAFSDAIARLPENVYQPRETSRRPAFEPQTLPAPGEVKEGGYVMQGGKVFRREGGGIVEQKKGVEAKAIISDTLKVRDALRKVTAADVAFDKEASAETRRELNRAYDSFVSRHGALHKKENAAAFAADPDAFLMLALEKWDSEKKRATKESIFEKSNITRYERPERAESIGDAVATSLNETAGIDVERIKGLLGVDEAEVGRLLGESKLAFLDPSKGWVHRELYLSGNVRRKLLEAKELASGDPRYLPNVEALTAAIPEDVDAADIDARLGVSWVQPSDVADFLAHLVGGESSHFKVAYIPSDGSWVSGYTSKGEILHKGKANDSEIWGTKRMGMMEIVQHALDRRSPGVTDPVWNADKGAYDRVPNEDETGKAQDKVKKVQDRFREWVWEDDARRVRLHRFYNDTMNNIAETKYDGSHLTFPGMAPEWRALLHPHIKNAIWRNVLTGRSLLAHEVGTGKTAVQIGTAMEWKRLGLAAKPAIVTLKPVINQFAREAREIYPNINLLSTAQGFTGEQRKRTLAQMATGDYDVVLMTHPNIDMLPMSPEVIQDFIGRELEELEAAKLAAYEADKSKDNKVVKQLEKTKKRLLARLKDAIEGGNKEDAVSFEQTGIDAILVDEAHLYKSLPVYTSMDRVKGIPTDRSDRATNMFMRTRWLLERNNGRGVVFATGTPISNSIVEMYTMQKYLQYPELVERNLHAFDAWARNFGDIVTNMEYKVTGEMAATTRFSEWSNLGELIQLSRSMMDVVFAEDVPTIIRPKKNYEAVSAPMSPEQTAYLADIQARAAKLKGQKVVKGGDNMLKISTDARKSAVDMRLIDPTHRDFPRSKVNMLVSNVLARFKTDPGLTQMIFSDVGVNDERTVEGPGGKKIKVRGFSVFKDIIAKLEQGGVPRNRIINFSDLTDAEKAGASQRLKTGDALIGLGSTATLGTGVNAQDLGIAQHHLDAPWVPAAIEQREGRHFRHGNRNKEIDIKRYVTTGSFDKFMWQTIDRKWRDILAVMKGDRKSRRMVEESTDELTPAQMRAVASGNPWELKRVNLEKEVKDLESAAQRHAREQIHLRNLIPEGERKISDTRDRLERQERDVAQVEAAKEKPFALKVGQVEYDDRVKGAAALRAVMNRIQSGVMGEGMVPVGEYKGFRLSARKGYSTPYGAISGGLGYDFNVGTDTYKTHEVTETVAENTNLFGQELKKGDTYTTTKTLLDESGQPVVDKPHDGGLGSIDSVLANMHKRVEPIRDEIAQLEKNLTSTRAQIGKPFKQAEQLEKKRAEFAEVMAKLKSGKAAEEKKAVDTAEAAARMSFESQVRASGGLFTREDLPPLLGPDETIVNAPNRARAAGQAGFINIGSILVGKRETSAREIITGIRRAGLLSAVKMHLRNVASNTSFAVSEEFARPFMALADIAASAKTGRRTKGGASLSSVGRSVFGKQGAVIKGSQDFWKAVWEGDPDMERHYQVRSMKSGLPVLDAYVNLVGNLVAAADRPAKAYALRRELDSLAAAEARNDHAKDPNVNVRDRAREYRRNPTEEMQREAVIYSEIATFQNDNPISTAIQNLKAKAEEMTGAAGAVAKTAKLAFELKYPFDRTPTNIFIRILEYTPVGVGMAAYKYRAGLRGAVDALEARRAEAAAEAVKENERRLREFERKVERAKRDAKRLNDKQHRNWLKDVEKAHAEAAKEYSAALFAYYEAAAKTTAANAGLFAIRDEPEAPEVVKPREVERPRDVTPVAVPAPSLLDPDAVAASIAGDVMSREDQRRFAETVGRAGLGNALGAIAIILLARGLLDISGITDYDDERDKAFAKRRSGVRDGSVRIPGTNIRILVTGNPLGNALVAFATAYEQSGRSGPVLDRVKAGAGAAVEIGKQQPLLKGQLDDRVDRREWRERVAEFGSSFLPRIGGEVGEVLDPEPRRVYGQGAAAQFAAKIPVPVPVDSLNRRKLPVQENYVGGLSERGGVGRRVARAFDPFEVTRQTGETPRSTKPLGKEERSVGIAVPPPPAKRKRGAGAY